MTAVIDVSRHVLVTTESHRAWGWSCACGHGSPGASHRSRSAALAAGERHIRVDRGHAGFEQLIMAFWRANPEHPLFTDLGEGLGSCAIEACNEDFRAGEWACDWHVQLYDFTYRACGGSVLKALNKECEWRNWEQVPPLV